jgi:2'-5' RNA ligase
VPLPEATVAAVADLVSATRASMPAAERAVRWVRLDGLHVTIRFLGATPPAALEDLAEAGRRAAAGIPPFRIAIAGAGAFPSESRPRAVWLGITRGAPELAGLAGRLDALLEPLGWAAPDRPFTAHLTLARADGVRAGAQTVRALIAAVDGRELSFRADRLVLFETVPGRGPARYAARRTARLG